MAEAGFCALCRTMHSQMFEMRSVNGKQCIAL